jgi:hypothetical protein
MRQHIRISRIYASHLRKYRRFACYIIPQFSPVIAGVDFFASISLSEKLEARYGVFLVFGPSSILAWWARRLEPSMENNSLETCDLTPKPFLRRRPEETVESIVDLLSRGVSVVGIAAPEADGVARKWHRKLLKRLNPRPEMVWPRNPRTHKIWYGG